MGNEPHERQGLDGAVGHHGPWGDCRPAIRSTRSVDLTVPPGRHGPFRLPHPRRVGDQEIIAAR